MALQNWGNIPEHMREGIEAYVERGRPPGGFLRAVLTNDLHSAVQRADHINVNLLPDYVRFLYWEVPGNCWGSPENVKAWLAAKQAEREEARA